MRDVCRHALGNIIRLVGTLAVVRSRFASVLGISQGLGLAKGLRSAPRARAGQDLKRRRQGGTRALAIQALARRSSFCLAECAFKKRDRTGTPGEDRQDECRAKPETSGELRAPAGQTLVRQPRAYCG